MSSDLKYKYPDKKKSKPKTTVKIIMALVVILTAGGIFYCHRHQQQQIELELDRGCGDSIDSVYRIQFAIDQAKQDSINREWKRYNDSVNIAERHPFSDDELIAMVRKHAPSYSDIELWRCTKSDWIMVYTREINYKDHVYLRQFDPVKNRFGKEREIIFDGRDSFEPIGQRYRTSYAHFKDEKTSRISYDERGYDISSKNINGSWNHERTNVTKIGATTKSPSQIRAERWLRNHPYYDDDDEDDEEREFEEYDEDTPENNSMEINLYYNPKYKPK